MGNRTALFLCAFWCFMATSDTTLDDNAAKPASVKTATAEVSQHSLLDQIEYDKYKAAKAAKAASASPLAGLRISKAGFGGTTGDS